MTTKEFNRCLRKIKSGNKQGMEELYNNYYEKLLFTAQLDVKNRKDAEDIVSNLLFCIFKNVANYKYIRKPNSWMYKALKFAIMNFKKQNRKYVYEDIIDEIYTSKDVKIDLKLDFKRFLQKQDERQQEVLQLKYVYGLKITEIAEIVNVSVSTVNRDIASLKDEFENFKKNLK